MSTATRMDYAAVAPDIYKAQYGLTQAVHAAFADAGLPDRLFHLLLTRASQLNGCAFCLDMHTKDARHAGEREDRLYLLSAWRESPAYDETERAALGLIEAFTLLADGHVPDDVWADASAVLDEAQMAAVIGAGVMINGWNRIAVTTRAVPGIYQPA